MECIGVVILAAVLVLLLLGTLITGVGNIFIACVVGGLLIDCYLLILIVCDWAIHALDPFSITIGLLQVVAMVFSFVLGHKHVLLPGPSVPPAPPGPGAKGIAIPPPATV